MNDTIAGDVARYATAVRAACADLPGPDRELLLEDLEDHLQEVAAEADGPAGRAVGGRHRPPGLAGRDRVPARAATGLVGAARLPGRAGARGRHDLPVHRGRVQLPRAPAARQLPARPAGGGGGGGRLGRPGATGRSWGARGLLAAGNAALVVVALLLVGELGNSEAVDDYRPEFAATSAGPVSGLRSDGREITNIFPFDAHGRPLQDVYLVDQDGHPVEATHYGDEYLEPELPLDRDGNEVSNRYPQVQHEIDAAGQRQPGPTPEFRPPPGPVRSP